MKSEILCIDLHISAHEVSFVPHSRPLCKAQRRSAIRPSCRNVHGAASVTIRPWCRMSLTALSGRSRTLGHAAVRPVEPDFRCTRKIESWSNSQSEDKECFRWSCPKVATAALVGVFSPRAFSVERDLERQCFSGDASIDPPLTIPRLCHRVY
jgi:hypothetical protein